MGPAAHGAGRDGRALFRAGARLAALRDGRVAVLIVNSIALDGESNWLEGAMLLAMYLILGIAFYFLP
jgi:calcium/proton exchanger cax